MNQNKQIEKIKTGNKFRLKDVDEEFLRRKKKLNKTKKVKR